MNKYQICLQSIVDAIALLFGYEYATGDAALVSCPYEGVPYKFFGLGYSRLSVDDWVFLGFGKYLLLSRISVHHRA